MEKGKRIEAEFQLPEAIIQHIQSFLNGKEAAQTTILSKSWYTAWLTRPNLDFDYKDFVMKSDNDFKSSAIRFWGYVKKTVERYEKLNLKIDSFRLWIRALSNNQKLSFLVNQLIVKAMKMGVTGLDFKIQGQYNISPFSLPAFNLPHEVFGFENLISLSVSGCKIGIGADGNVSCSRLKSLALHNVYVQGNIIRNIISRLRSITLDNVHIEGDTIRDIIWSCPLIEKFSLSMRNWRLSPVTDFGKRNVGSVVDSPFNKLKFLLLYGIGVDALFFHDFSSKFPCLKVLGVHHCNDCKLIRISSPSLECINFTQEKNFRAKFDVPNIRKFIFLGSSVPSLSFQATKSTWESDISITRQSQPSVAWFVELNKLLKKLSLSSRVSLSLEIFSEKSSGSCEGRIQDSPKPGVENLKISGPCAVCPVFLYSLFQCCRPTYITQNWFPMSKIVGKSNDIMEFVCKRTAQQVSLNSCIAYQRMSGECDLEEASVEFYDESVSMWRPRLLDTSTNVGADELRTRLHLRWGH